jgi:hypothetical protein
MVREPHRARESHSRRDGPRGERVTTCDWHGCAEEASLVYYDHPVCEDHWAQHCEGVINLKNTFDIKEGAPSGHN